MWPAMERELSRQLFTMAVIKVSYLLPWNLWNVYKINFVLGITGSTIKIDQFGDSEGNFSVLAIQPHNASDHLRDNFTCNYLMTPVAHFQQGNDFPVSESSILCFCPFNLCDSFVETSLLLTLMRFISLSIGLQTHKWCKY